MAKSDTQMLSYNEFYDLVKFRANDKTYSLNGATAAKILAGVVDGEQYDAFAEIANLKRELSRAKAMQYRLFKLVPAEALILLAKEYPEGL